MIESSVPLRSHIDPAHTWNAESVFINRDAWNSEFEQVNAAIPGLAARSGTISGGPALLAQLLEDSWGLLARIEILQFYANMSQAADTADSEAQTLVARSASLGSSYSATMSYFEPELLALGKPLVDQWVASNPVLAIYAHYIDSLFRRQAHVRSSEVEEMLGLADEVFDSARNIHDMLVNADLEFSQASDGSTVAHGSIDQLMSNPNRAVRRSAWHSYCDGHMALGNTLAATLATNVRKDVFQSKVRHFESSIDAALFDDHIPRSVFDNTIATFRNKLPIWHRYWKVRRKALGLDILRHEDIWAPITKVQPVVPFEQAVDWICEALAPLGSDYVEKLRRGCLEQRWVDRYPSKGKSAGAFCYGARGTYPFVMMSYTNDLSSVSTLAHELGHAMHSLHTWDNQPGVYASYSIFAAEVASNFNQALVRDYLFKTHADPQFQLALIEEALENFHRYFFIMPTLARFELAFHQRIEQGLGVNAEDLTGLMADLFAEAYGGELEIERDREGSTWAQFSHLYMNFYVFQYATGISAAHALAAPVIAGNQEAVRSYRDFLSCGSSRYPVDALRLAGVDMTGTSPMEKGFEVLEGLIDRLEQLSDSCAAPTSKNSPQKR